MTGIAPIAGVKRPNLPIVGMVVGRVVGTGGSGLLDLLIYLIDQGITGGGDVRRIAFLGCPYPSTTFQHNPMKQHLKFPRLP